MDCVKVRCFKIYNDYAANLINHEELKKRVKVIKDETESKQTSLPLKTREIKP